MAKHKAQHLVPACYLKNFEADITKEKKENPNFQNGIYINDKTLSSNWKLKSVTHTCFTSSYFYNLTLENIDPLKIEKFLSTIESQYPKYFTNISNHIINQETISFISCFAALQFARTEPQMLNTQDFLDQTSKILDAYNGKNDHQNAVKDLAKIWLETLDLRDIPFPHSAIIYSSTSMPFITSDNPVCRANLNITDIQKFVPKRYLDNLENKSEEFPVFILPLSPTITYISCELITHTELSYSKIDSDHVWYLNMYFVLNAHKHVYSSIIEPIPHGAKILETIPPKKNIIKIYTSNNRIITESILIQGEASKLTIKIFDLEVIKSLKKDENIKQVECIKSNGGSRIMKDCHISSIQYETGVIHIESNIKLIG